MPNTTNSITPYLHYADLDGAMEWLTKAFGFHELMRQNGPDKKARHAEMALGETGVVMMGWPGPGYRTPKQLGQITHNVYARIDDVDTLFERATKAGATVVERPADQPYGERRCGLEDPEGHRWYFAQPLHKG
ncbi:MAG: VOC family protein [Gammaproteobacteria bacterium]